MILPSRVLIASSLVLSMSGGCCLGSNNNNKRDFRTKGITYGSSQSYDAPPPQFDEDSSTQCKLCVDGEPTEDLTVVKYGDTSCNDLQLQAAQLTNSSDDCYFIQLLGVRYCGCPAELRKCTICADGSDPPNWGAIVGVEGESCRDLHESVSSSNDLCPFIQSKGFFQCGCNELPVLDRGKCSLCYNEFEEYGQGNIFNEDESLDYTCTHAAYDIYAAGTESLECRQHQAQAALTCGCQSVPPPPPEPSCTLCPGGVEPSLGDKTIPGLGVTCQLFHQVIPTLHDGATCHETHAYRNYCGCPEEAVCSLCNPGDEMVDPTKEIIIDSVSSKSCQEVHDAAQYIILGADLTNFNDHCLAYRQSFAPTCCPKSASIEPLDLHEYPTPSPTLTPLYAHGSEKQSNANHASWSCSSTVLLLLLSLSGMLL